MISVLAVEQAQQSVPQIQSQNVQSEAEPQNWFDTGDFISGNEPLLQRGRQYPDELINPSNMYQQQQLQGQQQQQVLQPIIQPDPPQPQVRPPVQTVQQPQPRPQQVTQPVQKIIQPVQQPVQKIQKPLQMQKPQQAVRPRPTVEKPPTYDYESNPPPRRKPSAGQRSQRPAKQGRMQVGPQQAVAVQEPQSVQVSQNMQNSVVSNRPIQHTTKGESVGVQPIQPSGRHQSISGKKGSSYKPSNTNQAPSITSNGKTLGQVQPQQSNKPKTGAAALSHQAAPQQGGNQQQRKGFYTDGGFIPATNNNMNNQPTNNQKTQNNAYRNMFNKDRYGYQYQNPLYGAQKPYGRQYDNYDYNNYVYGETPPSNYNYDYNSGTLYILLVFFSVFLPAMIRIFAELKKSSHYLSMQFKGLLNHLLFRIVIK